MKRTAGKSLRTRKAMEQAIHLIFLLCGIVAVGFVLCISVYLVISGLPAIREIGLTKFLFGKVWAPTNATTGPQFGILPFILTSVYGTAGALLLGVPVGLMTAIFLAKAAPPRLAAMIRTAARPRALHPALPLVCVSFAACAAALYLQLRYHAHLSRIEDVGAFLDTAQAAAFASAVLLCVTLALNALALCAAAVCARKAADRA